MQVRNQVFLIVLVLFLLAGCGRSGAGMLEWVRTLQDNWPDDMAVSERSKVYVTGTFDERPASGSQWVAGRATADRGSHGSFLACYKPDGKLEWLKAWGGEGLVQATSTAYSASEKALYVAGYCYGSIDLEKEPYPYPCSSDEGCSHGYFAKFDLEGSLIWCKRLESYYWPRQIDGEFTDGRVERLDICVNDSGDLYVAGYFSGTVDLDPDPDATEFPESIVGIFTAKYDRDGNFQWAKYWDYVCPWGISTDSKGRVYFTGVTDTTIDLDPGEGTEIVELEDHSKRKSFVICMDDSGALEWMHVWDGYCRFDLSAIDTGRFFEVGADDAKVGAYDQDGNPIWEIRDPNLEAYHVAGCGDGRVCFGASLGSGRTDLDPGPSEALVTNNHAGGIYIVFLDRDGKYVNSYTATADKAREGINPMSPQQIRYDGASSVYVVGYTNGTGIFGPGWGRRVKGERMFLLKLDLDKVY